MWMPPSITHTQQQNVKEKNKARELPLPEEKTSCVRKRPPTSLHEGCQLSPSREGKMVEPPLGHAYGQELLALPNLTLPMHTFLQGNNFPTNSLR